MKSSLKIFIFLLLFNAPRTKKVFNKGNSLATNFELSQLDGDEVDQGLLGKVRKRASQVITGVNPLTHVREMLIHHGTGAAITVAVTEVITVGIFPALLVTAGLPGLAALSAGLPSFALTVPMFIKFKNARQRKRLAKDLGFESLVELDALRKSILGFSIGTKVLSKVYNSDEGEVEINIVNRRFAKWRTKTTGNIIDLFQIENIAKEYLDNDILKSINSLSKENPSAYANVLTDQIQKESKAKAAFSSLIKKKMKGLTYGLPDHDQAILLLAHEKEEHIRVLKSKIRRFKTEVLEYKVNFDDLAESRKVLNTFTQNLLRDLEDLEMDTKRFEYGFLNQISTEKEVDRAVIFSTSDSILFRMKKVDAFYLDFSRQLVGIGLRGKNGIIRNLIKDMRSSNSHGALYKKKQIDEEEIPLAA